MKITGPTGFTDAVFAYLSETMSESITRANFSGISMPKHMADVLIMPAVAFLPGEGVSINFCSFYSFCYVSIYIRILE